MQIIQLHRRILWTASTCLSLLSARHLLLDVNFHYPFLLFGVQLVASTCLVFLDFAIRRSMRQASQSNDRGSSWRVRFGKGTWLVLTSMFCKVWSFLLYLQAILHIYNLPGLVMLSAVAFLVEDALLLLGGVRPCSQLEIARITALTLSCVGILSAEYRLSAPGLQASLPALLLTGLANGLHRFATTHYPTNLPHRLTEYQWLVGVGYMTAAMWVLCFWSTDRVFADDIEKIPASLAFYILFTTLALWLGGSVVTPPHDEESNDGENPDASPTLLHFRDTWTLMALVGAVGCVLTTVNRRSYTTLYQYLCFAVALISLSCRAGIASLELHRRHGQCPEAYELLDDGTLLATDEEILNNTIPEPWANLPSSRFRDLCGEKSRSLAIWLTFGCLWLSFACLNFLPRHHDYSKPKLDLTYEPPQAVEIVLNMYKEPTESIKQLIIRLRRHPASYGAPVSIYVKDQEANVDKIMRETGANRVVKRPNVGREGETYLFHILDNWETLSGHTVFLQADVHNSREFDARFTRYFDPYRTGFLNLGWTSVCSCMNCGDRFYWHDKYRLFPSIEKQIDNSSTCGSYLLSYKGQFIASAARIRGIDKTIYGDLWQAFVNETSWAHQPEFLKGRADSMHAPVFGYTMERMWPLLFQCNDLEIGWKCPTMLSGWRLGGDTSDCQCFDSSTAT